MGYITQLRDNSLYVAVFLNDYRFDSPLHSKVQTRQWYNTLGAPSSCFDKDLSSVKNHLYILYNSVGAHVEVDMTSRRLANYENNHNRVSKSSFIV
jgi:hypothetical protein